MIIQNLNNNIANAKKILKLAVPQIDQRDLDPIGHHPPNFALGDVAGPGHFEQHALSRPHRAQ